MASTEQQPNKKQQDKKQSTQTKRHSLFMGLFVLVLTAVAAGAVIGSYYLYQDNQTLQSQFKDSSAQYTKLNKTLDTLHNQQQKLKTTVDQNTTSIAALFLQEGADAQTVLLTEVRHLVYLASLSLYWQKDATTALALIKLADQKLQTAADPNLIPLRDQTTADITALQLAPKIDINGLLGQLDAISQHVTQLEPPLTPSTSTPTTPTENSTEASSDSTWHQAWYNSWDTIKNIIVVQHHGSAAFVPLTDPQQQQYVQQTIQIALQQAKLAVLQSNQALYKDSIQQAIDWLTTYFPKANAQVTLLKQLQNQSIVPKLPDLSDTLALTDKMMQQQTQP